MKRNYDNFDSSRGGRNNRSGGYGYGGRGGGRGQGGYDDRGYGGSGGGTGGGRGSGGNWGRGSGGYDDGRDARGYSGGYQQPQRGSSSQQQHSQPGNDGWNVQGGGRRSGGRQGGRDDRGGGRGRGGRSHQSTPDLSGMTACLSNVILADVSEHFQFFMYSLGMIDIGGDQIESRYRRKDLFDLGFWNGLLESMPSKEKEDLQRVVFFQGSLFYSARRIPGLEPENLPLSLPIPVEKAEGASVRVVQVLHYVTPIELQFKDIAPVKEGELSFDKRCADCTVAFKDVGALLQHCQNKGHHPVYAPSEEIEQSTEIIPATVEIFSAFMNLALQRALSERLARWGTEYIDPMNMKEPVDKSGRSLGVRVFEAYSCQFGLLKATSDALPQLGLTVDLRAKIVRTMSVMHALVGEQDPNHYNPSRSEQERCRREWIGEVVITMHDKKCYSVTDLLFDRSAANMPVEGLGMSHAEYFEKRKNTKLKYPNFRPMIAILGRRNQIVYMPAELVAGNELEGRVKQQLPMIASYKPEQRNAAIEKVRAYLIPGAQKSKGAGGLLPAIGIQLADSRLSARAEVLPLPMMMAAGVQVPSYRAENWAPMLNRASFNIAPKKSNTLQVIVFYNENIRGAINVYNTIRGLVNNYNALYRFSEQPVQFISTGDRERHWGAFEKIFSDKSLNPENIFVLDFNKPKGAIDPAYPVIKQLLTRNGFLSQFVNFNTYAHDSPRDPRRSEIILQGVARQILQKTGVRLWWVQIPKSLPTPTVVIGVDVFHAPRVYDPVAKKRKAKASCAAIIVQVFRESGNIGAQKVEMYSQTFARESGKEYDLGDALKETISSAIKELKVSPTSCIVWRDGIGDSALGSEGLEEIKGIRAGLRGSDIQRSADVPLAYIVAQKRIATKFLSKGVAGEPDGKYGAPSGTLVKGIQGLDYETFYINGRAPPYSTAKPVRFVVVQKDEQLKDVPIENLTWNLAHDYPNWTGPIKVPSAVQMAHKLAELGGSFPDGGNSMNSQKLKNKIHFL